MGLTILTARRSVQLSEAIYRRIDAALNENIYLMVPEQFTLGAEAGLIKANHRKGLLGVEVLSPKRLGQRVLKETGGLNKIYMDRHGRKILLQKALLLEELSIYKGSIQKSGFLEKMAALISELKQNELGPEDFLKIEAALPSEILKQKLSDIMLIYKNYNALMGDVRMDDEDLQQLFCQKIKDAQFLKDATIFIDGFQNFSRADYRLIENLMISAKAVIVALPLDLSQGDAAVFSLTAETLKRLKAIAGSLEISFHLETLPEKDGISPEISFLEKNLFAYPPQSFEGPLENIHLFQNQTIWDEVENAAGQILTLIRQRKCAYGDIVLLAGDLELYGSVIKGVFSQYKIPFFLDELRPIGDNHLVEAVMTALEAIAGNYRSEEILGYLKTGFSAVSREDGLDLENYSLEFGIRGSLWKKPFTLISQNPALDLEKINASRAALIDPLLQLKENIKAAKSCAEMTKALYQFLVETKVPETLDAFVEELSKEEDDEVLQTYDQIWNILMKVFDQIVETMGGDAISLNEYIRLLQAGISDYQLGVIPPQGDYVNITDLRRSRSQAFAILFVLGLNEGKIPGTGTEPNLITDVERRILGNYQFHLQNNLAFQMEQERFLVYDVLTRPQKSLFIHWALSDLEGNSLQPSHLLARIFRIFPAIRIASGLGKKKDALWDQINRPEVTLWKLIQSQADQKAGVDQEAKEEAMIWAAVRAWIENSDYFQQYQRGLKALDYNGIDAVMTPIQAENLYGRKMTTSISRLEQFVQCPFSHYVRYGLKPGKRLVYSVEAPEIGNLLHAVVDGFFKEVAVENLNLKTIQSEERDRIISDLMSKLLPRIKKNVFNSSYHYQYLGKKLERVSKRSIGQIIKQINAGQFLPEKTEFAFEKKIDASDFKEVKIQGKIDRLDIYRKEGQSWIKIIDYKTGNKSLSYEDIYFGLSLQLVVYLDGALTVLAEENLLPGGIFYFHVDDPILRMDIGIDPAAFNEKLEKELNKAFKLRGLLCDDEEIIAAMDEKRDQRHSEILPLYTSEALLNQEEFQTLLAYVRELVSLQIRRIYGGQIKAQPYQKDQISACTYCDYRGICQFDEAITKEGYLKFKKAMDKAEFFERIGKNQEDDDEELDR